MDAIISTTSRELIAPVPRSGPIATRLATMNDMVFIDSLQKLHNKALGFFPHAQMQGYIENQWVLIAEDAATRTPLGYCASRDRYLKRDELGVIYQLCVTPGHQRGLIGASLIKAVFERSAYGCRLYCCWCAQDLDANYFWESLGFVPIAFRGGSGKKKRVHLFWQKRIVENDATPYWYPCKTDQGAMRADRVVLPIPPGVHWRDVRPPNVQPINQATTTDANRRSNGAAKPLPATPPIMPRNMPRNNAKTPVKVRFGPPEMDGPETKPPETKPLETKPPEMTPPETKPPVSELVPTKKSKPPAPTIDPKYLAAARELRDRYLEQVNKSPDALPAPGARYDVTRALPEPAGTGTMHIEAQPLRQLPSAA